MPFERTRQFHRRGGHPVDAQRQRLQTLEQHPGVERRHRRPGVAHQVLDRAVDELRCAQDRPTQRAPLPVDVLCRRVDDDVRAQLKRLGEHRGAEHVVDDDLGPRVVSQLAHGRNVNELLHRVAGRLEEHRGRWLRQRRPPLLQIRPVDEDAFHPPARKDLVQDHKTGTKQPTRTDDPVPLGQECGQGDKDGGHAGGRGEARLCALEQSHPFLEHAHCRVAIARVDETVDLVLERGLCLLRRGVDVARGQEQSLRGLVEPATGQAPADRQCVRTQLPHPCLQGSPATFQPATVR